MVLFFIMYAPLQNKGSRKHKDKTRRKCSIEEGIPEVPRISDFQVTNSSGSSLNDESLHTTACELVIEVEQLDLNETNKEEQKKINFELNSVADGRPSRSVDTEEEKDESLGSVQYPQSACEEFVSDEVCQNFSFSENEAEKSQFSCDIYSPEKFQSDSMKISDYCNLAMKVKTYIEEINEPSAPTVEGSTATQNVSIKCLSGERVSNSEKPIDISKFSFSIILQDFLPAFSDEKLCEYYYNPELHESKTYVNEFIYQETNNETRKDNKLYRLLVEYMQAKNRLKASETKIYDLKEKLNICMSALWTVWTDVKVTEKEKCSDGNIVTFVEKYTQAQFNTDIFKEFSTVFSEIKHEVYQVHITDSFDSSILRLKIEYFLQSLLTSCPEFTNLKEDSSADLSSVSMNSHFLQCLLDLKIAISVLFMFQRKQSLEIDSNFLEETRLWLSDLVAVLLRVGGWKDHIFVLHHIMRCPGGVSEWATQFVQLPLSKTCVDPYRNSELNHMMTVMSILLSPVEERENFIKKWESELTTDVNPWTVIDSDGEIEDDDQHSCPLKENDLVSLLNQIPFGHLFKALLMCDGIEITKNYVTSDYVLKLFSFLTDFIKILLGGLKLYSTQRYRQFTKRLGRLIYHIVQYATDALIIAKSQKLSESELTRIQIEYDSFFLRSTKFIYSAKKHGTWQFLATIPYQMPSSNAILKLYGILQLNDIEDDCNVKVDFSKFVENFLLLPEEEQFYLLTTLANMALARDIVEIGFIKNVLLQLLFIGFLNPSTMDHCYKNVRSLLYSICSSYPFLMSEILCIQKHTFFSDHDNDQKLSIDLWAKLPVEIWQPEKRDLETLAVWLLEPVNCVRNELARLLLQSLNYGMNQGELFIPVEDQQAIALMILRANAKLVLGNEIGVIKNVSNLVLYQSPDQCINDWTWNVLLKLRLHLLDKSDAEMCKCFFNLPDCLKNIPDVENNIELHHLVLKRYPPACYIALMTTTLGHSVPIICDKGFELVEVLFNLGKYEPGLACLEHMTLLFLDCSDSLHKCERFISLLSRLIAADNSYVQFAKNLISYNFPGPVLKCVESMIQHQLNRWRGINFTSFSNVVQLWLFSLTRLPLWKQEPGILYLIDKLLQNSFFDSASAKKVTSVLTDLLEAESPSSETKSFLVGWMNSKFSPPSLLPKGFNGEVPWFSYHMIQIEYETYEKRSSVWIELLKELHSCSDKKINVDNSLKKVCNHLRIPVRSSSVLAIYKWSYQILETDFSHPLIPLLWQRFFSLYFYRVPGLMDRGSIGERFFDGVINQGLFKRLKARLQETCDHYKALAENTDESKGREHYLKCSNLFQSFSVWLYDNSLHKPCLSLHMLPIQYNPELLGLLIHESQTPWIEYLEYQNIELNFKNATVTWSKLKNRMGTRNRNWILRNKKEKSPTEKLTERLNSYENPLPPPPVYSKKYKFPRINIDIMMNANKMILFVTPLLQVLLDYAKQYKNGISEHVSHGCDMQELLPRLYNTVESQKVLKGHCTGVNKIVNGKNVFYSCSGPAVVKLNYQEFKLNEQVKQHLGHCKTAFEQNLAKAMTHLPPNLISAAVLIDIAIEKLNREYNLLKNRGDGIKIVNDLKGTGVHLFYELVRIWCERITQMPPLELAFENYVEFLGRCFIEGNAEENDRILNLILADDFFGAKVSKYFTPNTSPTHDFIGNYSKSLDFLSDKKLAVLSKFDLSLWLLEKKPKFSERSRMISAVGRGLKSVKGSVEERDVLKLLNQHLDILLMHDFPEHYGEVLNFLLEASESQSVSTSTWFSFLNALASGQFAFVEGRTDKNIFEPGQSVKKLKYYFSKFAGDQNLISFEVIKGTITLLASTFKAERLKAGTQMLYRKYRLYVEPIFIFFGMLSYSSVTKAVEMDKGSLSDKLAQQLWPLLSDLYAPWLVPFWVENQKDQVLQTALEQNFDHCVLLPWAMNDSCHSSFGASIFTESVRFLFDALPGLNHVLSHTWCFYVTNFAHIYVKDYILNVIHDSLLALPWETFFPSLQDVELMLRVVDQFLPLSHSFLGSIFVNVKWTELVHYYLSVWDSKTTTKLHICLLHLLVKLPLEPSLKQNEKVLALLTEASGYAWHLVDSVSYETVLNWFILSCDPRIILMDERLDYYKLDSTILRLLQVSAGYVPFAKLFHPTTVTKRLMYVRTCVKWLVTSNRRFKSKDSPLFKTALITLWSDMETVISETVPEPQRMEEAGLLLSEFLTIFTEPDLCPIVETTLSNWLSSRKSQVIVFGLFRAAGTTIENSNIFGSIIESALESYFNFTENCNWDEVTNALIICSKSKLEGRLEKVLIDNNYFLTLYTVLLEKESKKEGDFCSKIVLTDLLQLLSEVKLSQTLEPKLILVIIFGLKLAEREIKCNVQEGISYLVKFSYALGNFINDKGNGFLSAIGLKKSGPSNRFKLVCLIACSGICIFLKNNHPEYQESADEKILQALELAESNRIYQNIQQYASYAKTAVKEISTIGQIVNFLKHIGFKLFDKLYLKVEITTRGLLVRITKAKETKDWKTPKKKDPITRQKTGEECSRSHL